MMRQMTSTMNNVQSQPQAQGSMPQPSATNTIICSNCQSSIVAGSKFCNNCGEKVVVNQKEYKFCPKCGEKADMNSKFCGNCGNKF